MYSVSPYELAEWRKDGKAHQLVDIRELYEVETCSIGGDHIPMGEIVERMNEIKRDMPVVIHCKSGRRSEAVVTYLRSVGLLNVFSLRDGIMGWAEAIDPSMERY
jgi:adenylyltransferase/sulfurtransferase